MNHLHTVILRRVLPAVLLCIGLVLPALAQDEGDALLAEDGDLRIYRAEDGRIKIKRAGDDDWIAVVDPDREGRTFVFSGPGDLLDRYRVRDRDGDAEPRAGFFGPGHDFEVDVEPLALAGNYMRLADGMAGMRWNFEESLEISRMDADAHRLARRVLRAEGEERARLEAELDELLVEIFDAKQQNLQEQVEDLQERADDLRGRHDERDLNRDDIIERRKSELLGERDPLDW